VALDDRPRTGDPAQVNRVTIAHLSDPHLGPLPRVRPRELASKRLTGYMNYRRGRSRTHDMDLLERLIQDMESHEPDLIACTGDVANIGLTAEFPLAAAFLERLGRSDRVSFVPGNHDAYVRGSLDGLLAHVGAWATSDGAQQPSFPFVRRRGSVGIVGLSSAVPTLPFIASGTLGIEQIAAAEPILRELGREGLCRVVLIHHPPHRGGAHAGRGLTDAPAFEAMLARAGAELVLHGHNHVSSLAWRVGAAGPIPIVGAPSASALAGSFTHRAGYHLITIERDETAARGWRMSGITRGLTPKGVITQVGELQLSPPDETSSRGV
jgi:3',5'-cyclic AMP phosphodiesterase CpdA